MGKRFDGKWIMESITRVDSDDQPDAIKAVKGHLLEGTHKIVTEIKTDGTKLSFIRRMGSFQKIIEESEINLVEGTSDTITPLFGEKISIDFYQESDTVIMGKGDEVSVSIKIEDYKLVEIYEVVIGIDSHIMKITSFPAEDVTFDGEWVVSTIEGLPKFMKYVGDEINSELLETVNLAAGKGHLQEDKAITTTIKTDGNFRYIRRKIGTAPHKEYKIDHSKGSIDEISGPFGASYKMDLYWDETHRKIIGTGEVGEHSMKVTYEIVNGKYVETYTIKDATLIVTSISSDSLAFDGKWYGCESIGFEEMILNNPKLAKKSFIKKTIKKELWTKNIKTIVTKITTVGDERTICRKWGNIETTESIIDLGKGELDTVAGPLGEITLDLYWDEIHKKVLGTMKNEQGECQIVHEIVDGKLRQTFKTDKAEVIIVSSSEHYLSASDFQGNWRLLHAEGRKALRKAHPELRMDVEMQKFQKLLQEKKGFKITQIEAPTDSKMNLTAIFTTSSGEIGRFPTNTLDLTVGSPDPALTMFGKDNTMDLHWNNNTKGDGHQKIVGVGVIKGLEVEVVLEILRLKTIFPKRSNRGKELVLMETVTVGKHTMIQISVKQPADWKLPSTNREKLLKFLNFLKRSSRSSK